MKYIIVIAAVYVMASWMHSCRHDCLYEVKITEVGGCNRDFCGVRYNDGSFGENKYPVVGQRVCLKSRDHVVWDWWLI